jgi:hypothetical protein
MSLLNPPAAKPEKSRAMAFTVSAVTVIVIVTLWFTFRYYPEKKAASRFYEALAADNADLAYQLWKPSSSYSMKDFLSDWGPKGYYGPVKSYKILRANSPLGANAVAVRAEVSPFSPMPEPSDVEKSRKTKVVVIWVLISDKSLSFPP